MTCTSYCVQIEEIFDAMTRLADGVLPENRLAVSGYINTVWRFVTVFVQSIQREEGTEGLGSKFESHVTAEEARLRRNFEDIKYQVDDSDTLRVIAGEGRVEMVIKVVFRAVPRCTILTQAHLQALFPMFYLALKRGLERISLARNHVLSYRELSEALTMIRSIAGAGLDRVTNLRSKSET